MKQVLVRAVAIGAGTTVGLVAVQWLLLLGDGGETGAVDLGTLRPTGSEIAYTGLHFLALFVVITAVSALILGLRRRSNT